MPEIGKLVAVLEADVSRFQAGLSQAQKQTTSFSSVLKGVGVAAGALAGVGAIAVKMAADFEAPMRNVNSMLKLNEAEFSAMQHQVLELSKTVPASAETLATGLYQIVSAGVPATDAIEVLGVAARAGAAGLATTEEAAGALVAVIKGMGMEFGDADVIADKLFKTVELGVTTFPELSATIGRVIPLANAAGVSLDEVLGATASLTGITGNTAEVMTQLRATLQALIKPTADMEMAYVRLGSALLEQGKLTGPAADKFRLAQDAASDAVKRGVKDLKPYSEALREAASALGPTILQTEGFGGTLQMLGEYAAGDTAKLGKMFGSVESLTAVMALSGAQATDFAAKTAAMASASEGAGAATEALAEQSKGFNYQANLMMNNVKAMAMGFTVDWLPVLAQGAMLLPVLSGGVGVFAIAIRGVIPLLVATNVALGPIGWTVMAVVAAIGLLALAWSQNWGDIQGKTEAVVAVISGLLEGLQRLIGAIGDALGRLGEAVGGILGWLGEATSGAASIGVEGYATGGIVTRPTLALVGERGPEAIVPLGSSGHGALGATFNFYVAGSMVTERDLVLMVRDELVKLQARNRTVGLVGA